MGWGWETVVVSLLHSCARGRLMYLQILPGIVYIPRSPCWVRLIDGRVIIWYFGTTKFSRALSQVLTCCIHNGCVGVGSQSSHSTLHNCYYTSHSWKWLDRSGNNILVPSVNPRPRELSFVKIKTLSLYSHLTLTHLNSIYKLFLFVKKIFLEISRDKRDIEMFGITFYLLCD